MDSPPPGAVIEARGLVRMFGRRRAVAGVDVDVRAGEALALFGPNGAGKTTLLRLLAGLLKPTAGTVKLDGLPARGDEHARGRVGFISHHSLLYGALTARENLEFAARLYGVPDPKAAAERALGSLRVRDRADSIVRLLSRGLQQRVSIARAIVHSPSIVLLDEPYTGLDAAGAAAFTDALLALRHEGAAMVLVTHNVAEGLAMATHAAVMIDGRLVRHEPRVEIDEARYAADYQAQVLASGNQAGHAA